MSSKVLTNALGSLRAAAIASSVLQSAPAASAAWAAPSAAALGRLHNLPSSAVVGARELSSLVSGSSFTLPELPYAPADLAPHISGEIMTLHHGKHHAAYVAGLNAALDKYAAASAAGRLDECVALQGAIRFHGGGHLNHSIFWANLAPAGRGGGGVPGGDIGAAIAGRWGSFAEFKKAMTAAAAAVQGSGWAWLGYSKASGRLEIAACANQDPLLAVAGLTPLLGIDVWEHAYYLQYKNVRGSYLEAIWSVINWSDVGARFAAAKL